MDGALGDRSHGDARVGLGAHEPRQQRHGLPIGYERQAHDAVVGAVTDIGVEPSEVAAGPVGYLLPSGSAMAGCPGITGELGLRNRAAVTLRRRVVFGEHDVEGIEA